MEIMTVIVNGQKIEDSLIEYEIQRLRPEYEKTFADMPKDKREKQLRDWSKENVIERTLLTQQAEKENFEISNEQVDAQLNQIKNNPQAYSEISKVFNIKDEQQLKEHIELELKIQTLSQKIRRDAPEPSNEKITEFYNKNKEHFAKPETVRAAHIVKHPGYHTDESEAQKIMNDVKKQLDEGTPFETLASQHSDCPDNAGDLGNIVKGQMVEEFENVVFNLGPGQISNVFKTRFGFHIAKVYERTPASYHKLDDVRDQIITQLKQQKQAEIFEQYLDNLKSEATIQEN